MFICMLLVKNRYLDDGKCCVECINSLYSDDNHLKVSSHCEYVKVQVKYVYVST